MHCGSFFLGFGGSDVYNGVTLDLILLKLDIPVGVPQHSSGRVEQHSVVCS